MTTSPQGLLILLHRNNLAKNDCFNMIRFYSNNTFLNQSPGKCLKFVKQFSACRLNADDTASLECHDFFQKVLIDSIPSFPLFSPSTWAMWGFMAFVLILILSISFYSKMQSPIARKVDAILKKNWVLWRFNWRRNVIAYALPLIFVAILHLVITRFTLPNVPVNAPSIEIPTFVGIFNTTEKINLSFEQVHSTRFNIYQNLR